MVFPELTTTVESKICYKDEFFYLRNKQVKLYLQFEKELHQNYRIVKKGLFFSSNISLIWKERFCIQKQISMVLCIFLLFIISVQLLIDKGTEEKTVEEMKKDISDRGSNHQGTPNRKNGKLIMDKEMYYDYFQNNRNDASAMKARELLKQTAISISPDGAEKIPKQEEIPSFFRGNKEEMAHLQEKNNKEHSGNLINNLARKAALLEQAGTLIENKQIKAELSYLANELTEIKFYRIDETEEFIQAYKRYTELQTKLLEIHYAIEST